MHTNMALIAEPKSEANLAELFAACPLATVEWQQESGNVIINLDCNVWGEATSKPHLRKAPMSKDVFKKMFGALLKARCGTATPEVLKKGDIFTCFDGGCDRKR